MPWLALAIAGLMEAVWALALSRIHSAKDWLPIFVFLAAMALSMGGLAYAMRTIPLGTAYAVWTGIGAFLTALIGMAFLGESTHWPRILFLTLIVGGVIGLHMSSE